MRKLSLLKTIFAVFLLLRVNILIAIDPAKPINLYKHKAWNMEDGLPMNSVLAITQTPEGYLWVGTEAGLARFDGLEFEVFDHENTPALSKSLILSLMVSRDGILYAGTRGGGLVRFRDGNFEAFTTQNGLLSDEVWTTMESGDGTIWIGTRNGINILNEGKLIPLPLPADILPHNVRALCEDRFGRVWVGTRGCGLFMVRRRGPEV